MKQSFGMNFVQALVYILFTTLLLSSCAGSGIFNRSYLDDADMTLSMRKMEKSEMSFQLYREGSAGATGGKSGGGCGCN